MELIDMEGCCKAAILCDFGGGEYGDEGTFKGVFSGGYHYGYQTLKEAKENWKACCQQILAELKVCKRMGNTLIVYANTTHQPWARKFLRSLGFHKTKRQKTSGDRPLDGWYLLMSEFNPDKVTL